MLQCARLDQTIWSQDGSVKSQILYGCIFRSICLVRTGVPTAVCVPRTALVDFIPSADDDICAGNFHVFGFGRWCRD